MKGIDDGRNKVEEKVREGFISTITFLFLISWSRQRRIDFFSG